MNLYITCDNIGSATGGGKVTYNELEALKSLGPTTVINPPMLGSPFEADELALTGYKDKIKDVKIAHFYAGTFSKTVKFLKENGVKVTYTCAAHDVQVSKEEHEKLGIPFAYPHLVNPDLFQQYIQGYKDANVVISPSTHSKKVMEKQGIGNIQIIPHGTDLPTDVKPIPEKPFIVGYLGQPGADKSLIYLIQAWARLNYSDAQLVIAGNNTETLLPLVRKYGKGSIYIQGYVKSVSTFYNSISLYCQNSSTEGMSLEVLEAMSYGRPVVCSDGVGAADCIKTGINGIVVPRRNPLATAEAIDYYKKNNDKLKEHGTAGMEKVKDYTWEKIKEKYCEMWKTL